MIDILLNYASVRSYGFHVNPNYTLSSPQPKTYSVDIPYGHGELDLTESLTGGVNYQNRKISFTLEMLRPKDRWITKYNEFLRNFHGKTFRISLPNMDGYYYGRITVGDMKRGDYMSFLVTADCVPFAYKSALTTITRTLSATSQNIFYTLSEGAVPVVPTIVTTGNATITHKGQTFNVNAGTHTLPIIFEKSASQYISASGTGSITIRYQERML